MTEPKGDLSQGRPPLKTLTWLMLGMIMLANATSAQRPGAVAADASAVLAPPGAATNPDRGFKLSRDVEEALAQLQDRWLLLNSAMLQGDAALAESAVEDLSGNLQNLGFDSAPELGQAMATRGLEAARQGDNASAELAFRLAVPLDPHGSAVHFGRARAGWGDGQYFGSLAHTVRGYSAALADRGVQRLAFLNGVIWLLLSLLISAVAFIALQFATKGSRLLKDLRSKLPLPPLIAGSIVAVLLLLPALLPSGWLWMALVWAVLVWGHTSTSERWVLSVCILLLGAVPSAFNAISTSLPLATSAEGRLLDDLEARRFKGQLLVDLSRLEQGHSEDPAVLHLIADIHERLGQDDVARPYYRRVVDMEPLNGSALNNLGVFHSRRRERVAAIEFLQSAADLSSSAGAAGYNLSRLYDQLLEFGNSQRYLRIARESSSKLVEQWERDGLLAVSLVGGFERIPEVRRSLVREARGSIDWLDTLQPIILSMATLALAAALQWLGLISTGTGWLPVSEGESALGVWARRLIPGLQSAEAGDGGRAFTAILIPVGIVCWIAAGWFGYPLPWGLEPGKVLLALAATSALAVFFSIRAMAR